MDLNEVREKFSNTRGFMGRATRLAAVIVAASCLAACQGGGKDSPKDEAANLLPSVSLYGVRVGMTPADLQAVFPGAYCAPTADKPSCTLPSSVRGADTIEVSFRDGRVVAARADVATGGWAKSLPGRMADQLGQPTGDTDDYTGTVWKTRDGVELQLSSNSSKFGPTTYRLDLVSPDEQARRKQAKKEEREAAIESMEGVLSQVMEVAADGRISICGFRVGASVNAPIRCESATRMKVEVAGSEGCVSRHSFSLQAPTRTCLTVVRSPGTDLITSVSASVPVDSLNYDTLRAALHAIPNATQLTDQDSTGLTWLTTEPQAVYDGGHGDVLVVTPWGVTPLTGPDEGSPGTIELSVHGKGVDEAVFR